MFRRLMRICCLEANQGAKVVLSYRLFFDTGDICIYKPLSLDGMWHKVNFKQSLIGLNLDLSFS